LSIVKSFLQAFIPLFVAIDAFGVLPLYVGLIEGLDDAKTKRLPRDATLTAFCISLLFLIAGQLVFSFMGITESDFRVGGGVVLLVLSVHDLLFTEAQQRSPEPLLGVVPIGIPLIMGPAALTTIMLNVNSYGYAWTVVSLVANMALVFLVFSLARTITRKLGKAGMRAVAKVFSLFMAGIAIMMIRSGIEGMLRSHGLHFG
jgi:multiple antibiotic resistance protein